MVATTKRDVRHHRTEQNRADVARGVDRYVCLLLSFFTFGHGPSCILCVLMSVGNGKVEHKEAYPSSHSGNGDVLLFFVSAVR